MTVATFADRCLQESTSTGAGSLVLAAPSAGFRALSSSYAPSVDLPYAIEGVDAGGALSGQWEVGRGHLNGLGELVRDVVFASSTGGFVNFTSASLRVFVSMSAGGMSEWIVNNGGTFPEIATPATPASGFGRIYFKSDGRAYALNDAGVETDLQATGGGYATIEEDGSAQVVRTVLNFVGSTFTASDVGGKTQVAANDFSSTTRGVVPASGGGTSNFLRADGTWATPALNGYTTIQEDGSPLTQRSTLDFVGDSFTASDTGSKTQVVANNFSPTTRGVVPASGGGTTNFLRADGTWAAPPVGVTDHGALTGLGDDDHTQYVLVDGTRAMTGSLALTAGHIQVPEIATPATPASGFGRLYAKSDSKLYFLNDGGTEYDLTATGAGMAIGGSITSATAGSVLFAGAAGVLAQDNSNLFWDDTNNRLGIGTASPAVPLHIEQNLVGDALQLYIHNTATTGSFPAAQLSLAADAANGSVYVSGTSWSSPGTPLYLADQMVISAAGDASNGMLVQAGTFIVIGTGGAGAANERVRFKTSGEVVFNDAASDYDHRIESVGNTHAFFLDASTGNIGINESAPGNTLEVNGTGIVSKNNGNASFILASAAAGPRNLLSTYLFHGTLSSPTDVTNGDALFELVSAGYAGGANRNVASMEFYVGTGTISATSLPTYMAFFTTPDGSITRAERFRIHSTGNASFGTTSDAAQLTVDNGSTAESIFLIRDNNVDKAWFADGGHLNLANAVDVVLGTTTGSMIGTSTSQKLGFYGATPIVQGASVADATGGATVDSEARTAINALISRVEALGLIATV
jgi:hypothetical protein